MKVRNSPQAYAGIGILFMLASTLLSACNDRTEATPTPTPTDTPTPTHTSTPTPTATETPAPTATSDPSVSVDMREETRRTMDQSLRVRFHSFNKQLREDVPEGLTGSLEAAGQARYALADFGGGRPLAVIADVTATNEDLQFGSGPWGTLYVGATVDGSLADPVARPFLECCAEVELTLSYEYKGEQARLPVRVYARIDRQYRPWSDDERARLQALEDRGDWDAVNAMYDEREVNGFEVYAEFWNEGLRAGELPGTGELFLLQPASPATRFDQLQSVRVLQDLDRNGLFEEDVIGEVQQAFQAVLVGIDTAWEIRSVSPSGSDVQLLPKRTGILAGRAVKFGSGGPIPVRRSRWSPADSRRRPRRMGHSAWRCTRASSGRFLSQRTGSSHTRSGSIQTLDTTDTRTRSEFWCGQGGRHPARWSSLRFRTTDRRPAQPS